MTDNKAPTFHGRMRNIVCWMDRMPPPNNDREDALGKGYSAGHRDAIHDAAVIANEADEAIRELHMQVDALTVALDNQRTIARSLAERRDEALEEVARLREEIAALTKSRDYVTSELRSAVGRLGLRPTLADALKGADPDKATAEQLARFLWIRSHDTSSSSASDAAMRFIGDDRERFAAAINEARAWMQAHRGGEWVGWSCAVLTGSQEVTSPGWYALPPGQWCGEPHILIERAERDGLELPTVAEAVATMGVTVKVEE